MEVVSVIPFLLIGIVTSLPVLRINEDATAGYRPMVPVVGSGHKPIYDDETTTTLKPTRPTRPPTPTPMSANRMYTIRQIQRYQKALRHFLTSQPHATPDETWLARSQQLHVSDDELNKMSESELHNLLGNIRSFYSATLNSLCCPLGK